MRIKREDPSSQNRKGTYRAAVNPNARTQRKGGTPDREWKEHKWVSRKRNADGKWVYEYDFGKYKREKLAEHGKSVFTNLGKAIVDSRKPREHGKPTPIEQSKSDFDKAVEEGRRFIDILLKPDPRYN